MRKNITANEGLEDSLLTLQKRMDIDIKKELAKLKGKPDSWIRLLKAIDGEK